MEIILNTTKRQEMIDITSKVQDFVTQSNIKNGLVHVASLHTTSAIIINENEDKNICEDIFTSLNELIPQGKWEHDKIDGNGDSHIKSCLLGSEKTIPIKNNKLILGTYQAIQFIELDGPRENRKIIVSIIKSQPL
jgi:secondary thiamine-phosphate synthase enzyme